ncbi:transcription factor LHW [Trifolium repens]|nr:transcription factor LHW [Trifolium repens]
MAMAMTMPFSLRNKLKTLCAYGDGWSYAIFWRFHEKNPMLLNVKEAYYEDQLGEVIQNMIPQVHLLGEGIVGEAAFTNKHGWLHSVSCEVDSGLYQQFSSGIIKTIVVIPVKACGVVQFGSRNKIFETMDFLDRTQSLLKDTDDIDTIELSGNDFFPLDFTNDDLNGLIASISSENSCDWNLNIAHDENHNDLREVFSSCEDRSLTLSDQLKCTIEAFMEPNSSMDNLISQNTPFFAFETMAQEVSTSFASSVVHDSSLSSLQYSMDNVVTKVDLPASSGTLDGISSRLEPIDMSEEILKFSSMDDLCQWFAPLPEATGSSRTMIQLDSNVSEPIECNPTCSDLGLAEKETSVVIHSSENNFLDNMEFDLGDLGCDQGSEWWVNLLTPVVSAATDNTGFSECVSELNTSTPTDNTRKRLFSELGIEEFLRGETNYINPFNTSSFENELSSLSNKKHTVEFSPMNRTSLHFGNVDGAETRANLMHSVSELDKSSSVLTMLVNDRNSINIKSAVPVHPRRSEEPMKPTKKKAKPGESTRPRPKDRQQIQDCIKELRGIIPHGGKCSIDSLLDRTIRYMLFLRGIIKYADILPEPNEPKLIDQENEVIPKDKNHGATWAYEVANQTMVCPIIVEDMNPPGQMLIEMLCEDQGFFLEIVDIIRGFGLNILKAKMDLRKNKLWARFIVEANRHVTRIDVFWSLIHLLQQPNASGIDSSNKHGDEIPSNIA